MSLAPSPFAVAADKMCPDPNPFLNEPVGWVTSTTGEFIWSKQRQIAQSVHDNRYTAVKSCHGSGKSFTAARIAAWWLTTHAPGEAFVVTTAPTYKQVHAVLWREIGRAHRLADLPGRITLEDEWYIGQELVGFGRKPADYDPSAFQGIHARYVLVIVDEAGGVPKTIFDAVDSLDEHPCPRPGNREPRRRRLALRRHLQAGVGVEGHPHQRLRYAGVDRRGGP